MVVIIQRAASTGGQACTREEHSVVTSDYAPNTPTNPTTAANPIRSTPSLPTPPVAATTGAVPVPLAQLPPVADAVPLPYASVVPAEACADGEGAAHVCCV